MKTDNSLPNNPLLNTKEAAKALGFSHKTLEAWRMRGQGPGYLELPNKRIRYLVEELRAWASGTKSAIEGI